MEECRSYCLLHVKKMDWFNKLSQEDRNHKAMMAKNKLKVFFFPAFYHVQGHVSMCTLNQNYNQVFYRDIQNILLHSWEISCWKFMKPINPWGTFTCIGISILMMMFWRKKYEGKFDRHPPRALFKGSYGAYRVEGSTLDQKYALEDTGLTTDPWEKFNLEYVLIQGV